MPHKFKVGDIVTLKPSDGVADKLVSILHAPLTRPAIAARQLPD